MYFWHIFRESSSPASHVLQWGNITGCVSIDGPCILVCEPIPASGLHPRAIGAEMSMDACATGARSRWALKRVKCGKSYMGSCDGLHGYLDGNRRLLHGLVRISTTVQLTVEWKLHESLSRKQRYDQEVTTEQQRLIDRFQVSRSAPCRWRPS